MASTAGCSTAAAVHASAARLASANATGRRETYLTLTFLSCADLARILRGRSRVDGWCYVE